MTHSKSPGRFNETPLVAPLDPPGPERLNALREAGIFNALDVHLALTLGRMAGESSAEGLLAVALASHGMRHGQVCIRLKDAAERPAPDPAHNLEATADGSAAADPVSLEWPDPRRWIDRLRRSPLVGGDDAGRPLVLNDRGDLYLARYRAYELQLARALGARIDAEPYEVNREHLRAGLDRHFGVTKPNGPPDWQKVAAMTAALRHLTVITGGPGTGKTTTVIRLLAVLQELQIETNRDPLRVTLLAPTGKAAARLAESIRKQRDSLDTSDVVRAAIDSFVSTIHRALGIRPGSRDARYDANHPLPADVVIVDESSMVDLSLMTRLVAAVAQSARLVLLGDRHQLASVEAGAILGDLCNDGRPLPPWSAAAQRDLSEIAGIAHDPEEAPSVAAGKETSASGVPTEEAHPIRDCIVELTHSHRFSAGGQIAALANAIRRGDGAGAISVLTGATSPGNTDHDTPIEVTFHELGPREDPTRLVRALMPDALQRLSSTPESDPRAALAALGSFRILCAHRSGPLGSEAINHALEQSLAGPGRGGPAMSRDHAVTDSQWYSRRPIMITTNDYPLGLYNGDVGIALPQVDTTDESSGNALRVYFPQTMEETSPPAVGSGADTARPETRSFHPARLPVHETVYAMTVHKSQGSEFDDVLLVLPTHASPILTRELIYTGVTRARRRLVVVAKTPIFLEGIQKRIRRASGLRETLWPDPEGKPGTPPTRVQRRLF